MSGFGIFFGNYIRAGLAYRWIVLVPAVLVFAVVTLYVTVQPDTYESYAILMKPIVSAADNESRNEINSIAQDMFRSAAQRMLGAEPLTRVATNLDPYPEIERLHGIPAVVEHLRKKIRVDVNRATNVITVTCAHSEGKNPAETATNIVNQLVGLFREYQLGEISEQAVVRRGRLQELLRKAKAEFEEHLEALHQLENANKNALPPDVTANNLQIDRYGNDVKDFQAQKRALDARIDQMNREEARLSLELDYVGSGTGEGQALRSAIAAGEHRLKALSLQLKLLMDEYADDNPRVVRLKSEIEYTTNMNEDLLKGATEGGSQKREEYVRYLIDENRKEIESTRKEKIELDKRIAETELKIQETLQNNFTANKIETRFNTLRRNAEEAEARYTKAVERHDAGERNFTLRQERAPIQIAQTAYVQPLPAGPDRLLISLGGLALGLGVGIGLAILRVKMDRSYNRPDDLRALLPGAVLVTVPEIQGTGARVGVMFASVLGGLLLAGIFTATVAILGVQVGWWGDPEMVRTLINLR